MTPRSYGVKTTNGAESIRNRILLRPDRSIPVNDNYNDSPKLQKADERIVIPNMNNGKTTLTGRHELKPNGNDFKTVNLPLHQQSAKVIATSKIDRQKRLIKFHQDISTYAFLFFKKVEKEHVIY